MRITNCGNSLLIQPWDEHLADVCTNKKHVKETQCRVVNGRKQFKRVNRVHAEPLYAVRGTDGFVFGGLFETVYRKATALGFNVEVVDLRPPLPSVNTKAFDCEFRDGQAEALDAIFSHQCGIIDAAVAFGKTFIIERVCVGYFKQKVNILVVLGGDDLLRSVHSRIEAHVPAALCSGKDTFDPNTSVCVCSAKSLHKIPVDWPELVLYDECHTAAAPETSRRLQQIGGRKFGFSGTVNGRSDNSDTLTTALFGPVIYSVDYAAAVAAGNVVPISVRIVPTQGVAITANPDTGKPFFALTEDVDFERWNIWRNRTRNEAIAKACRKLQNSGAEKLLVMVAKLEHAYYLKALLPEFEVVHGGLDESRAKELAKLGVLPADFDPKPNTKEQLARFKNNTMRWAIATWKWKEGYVVALHARESMSKLS